MDEGMRAERRRELYAWLQYVLEVLLLDRDVALRLSVASERLDLVENGAVRHHDDRDLQAAAAVRFRPPDQARSAAPALDQNP